MNARQRRQDRRRITRRAEGIHPDAIPAKCPITGRPYFMTLDHPELGMVPTYGGPYDSYSIPHAEGKASQPWHERELVQHRYDHDAGGWLLDVVETIPLRIIHDDVRDRLEDAEETLKALGYVYQGHRWKLPDGVSASRIDQAKGGA